jgi:flagellin
MNLRINHNIQALNAYRNLNQNVSKVSKAMEKLSSGLRINQAADDAAGLTISEKMRSQIRGLSQAERNILDGVSLIQTSEGGMTETHSLLQRVRELAVQASNDTLTDDDRNSIQNEVTQLIKEVDTIANNTEFNGLSLLNGQYEYDVDGGTGVSGSLKQYVKEITTSGGITDTYTYGGTEYASVIIDFSNINSADDVTNLVGKGVNYTCCTCTKAYSIKFVDGDPDTSRLNNYNPVMEVDVSSITNGTDLVNKIIETAYGQQGFIYEPTPNTTGIPNVGEDIPNNATEFVKHYSQLASDGGKLYIYDHRSIYAEDTWPTGNRGKFELNVYGETGGEEDKVLQLNIQAGSESEQSVSIFIPNVTVEQLGISDLLVNTQENASLAITKIDNAISRVSIARTTVGAYQNKFENIHNNVSNYKENLTNAESRVRDVDMALQMTEFTKNNILNQSAQTMLAQSNQLPQGILQLLK